MNQTLLTLKWLCSVETECNIAKHFGVSKSTACNYIYSVIDAIYFCFKDEVDIPTQQEAINYLRIRQQMGYPYPNILFAIDGTHFPCADTNTMYYSHKLNRAGLASMIAADLVHGKIICGHHGSPASVDDLTLFRHFHYDTLMNELQSLIPNDNLLIAGDAGFFGHRAIPLIIDYDFDNQLELNIFHQIRGGIERVFARWKRWFPRLTHFHLYNNDRNHSRQTKTIAACAILNNIVIDTNNLLIDDLI